MKQTLITPSFKDEKEEADWYDSNQDELLAQFQKASQEGTLGRGSLARRIRSAPTSIRLNTDDIALAKTLAGQRGIPYQTYLKMIIHQHLVREADGQKS